MKLKDLERYEEHENKQYNEWEDRTRETSHKVWIWGIIISIVFMFICPIVSVMIVWFLFSFQQDRQDVMKRKDKRIQDKRLYYMTRKEQDEE